jgi:hypothetical protein
VSSLSGERADVSSVPVLASASTSPVFYEDEVGEKIAQVTTTLQDIQSKQRDAAKREMEPTHTTELM